MIDVQLVIKLGIIGYGNQAKRLITIFNEIKNCNIELVYHPTKSLEHSNSTNNFSDLLDCHAVVITTPNNTHFEYIQKLLENFDGYIFCEKPPLTSKNHIEILEKISKEKKEKIFFNFNYRFGEISKIIKNSSLDEIGNIISVNITLNHGLAFKTNYQNSWRANAENNQHNILDTLSIHYVDLANFLFGIPKNIRYFPSLMSNNGSSFDTCKIFINYEDGKTIFISNSYASPYLNEITIVGTNGLTSIRDDQIITRSPRDTFNEKGSFIQPPIISEQEYNLENEYIASLKSSLLFFISKVEKSESIDLKYFKSSMETNQIILKLHENPEIDY